MKSKKLFVTKDSVNLIRELNSYSWKLDANGEPMEVPVKLFDDLCDALRYSVYSGEKIKISLAMVGAKKNNDLNGFSESPFRSESSDSRFRGY